MSLRGAAQSWSMNYSPELAGNASPPPLAMVMNAAKSDDPTEDEALALWNEGRKEEAIALLEKQIARERDAGLSAAPPEGIVPAVIAASPQVIAPPVVAAPVAAAPPVVVAPVVAAQALSARRANARFRYLGIGSLALLVLAGGALAWNKRDFAQAVLADVGVVQSAESPRRGRGLHGRSGRRRAGPN